MKITDPKLRAEHLERCQTVVRECEALLAESPAQRKRLARQAGARCPSPLELEKWLREAREDIEDNRGS